MDRDTSSRSKKTRKKIPINAFFHCEKESISEDEKKNYETLEHIFDGYRLAEIVF